MSAMEAQMRQSSARVILDGDTKPLNAYLAKRRAAHTRVNLNHLGEAILGEAEAAHRMESVLGHLSNPNVDYISVKISAIFSQINIIDFDRTLADDQRPPSRAVSGGDAAEKVRQPRHGRVPATWS